MSEDGDRKSWEQCTTLEQRLKAMDSVVQKISSHFIRIPPFLPEKQFLMVQGLNVKQHSAFQCFEQMRKLYAKTALLPERIQKSLVRLCMRGWFIDLQVEIATLLKLGEYLAEGMHSNVDSFLIAYYADRVSEIEECVIRNFNRRREPLLSAFVAHRRGEYFLSIPVFLAQADGIAKEITRFGCYAKEQSKRIKNKRTPKISQYIGATDVNSIVSLYLQCLKGNLLVLKNHYS